MKSSIEFQSNKILFRAPILSGKGWEFAGGDSRFTLGQRDVVDLNGNGVDTYSQGGFWMGCHGYHDPALNASLKELRVLARACNTEVLTAADVDPGSLFVEDLSVKQTFFAREQSGNRRSLNQLARQQAPGFANPEWAIDTVRGEFLVCNSPVPAVPIPKPTSITPASPSAQSGVSAPTLDTTTPIESAIPHQEVARISGVGLLAGCALAMGGMVAASQIHGPASLVVMGAGFLAGGTLAALKG